MAKPKNTTSEIGETLEDVGEYVSPVMAAALAGKTVVFPIPEAQQQPMTEAPAAPPAD